jgi:hypothetical protein
MVIFPWEIFWADYIPWSITADAMKAYMYARNVRIACILYSSRRSQLKTFFIGRKPWILSFREKKNRTQIEQKVRVL